MMLPKRTLEQCAVEIVLIQSTLAGLQLTHPYTLGKGYTAMSPLTINRLSAALLLLWLSSSVVAQSLENAPNSVYFELGGNAVVYSMNYDRLLSESFSARIGFMYFPQQTNSSVTVIPIMANYLIGTGNSKIEVGAGLCILSESTPTDGIDIFGKSWQTKSSMAATAVFVYRFQPTNPGLNFRVGFTPLIGRFFLRSNIVFIPWFGISGGYSF